MTLSDRVPTVSPPCPGRGRVTVSLCPPLNRGHRRDTLDGGRQTRRPCPVSKTSTVSKWPALPMGVGSRRGPHGPRDPLSDLTCPTCGLTGWLRRSAGGWLCKACSTLHPLSLTNPPSCSPRSARDPRTVRVTVVIQPHLNTNSALSAALTPSVDTLATRKRCPGAAS